MITDNVNAEIVAIGTEILLGELTDTNSVYLAQQLRDIGINLYLMTSVGDNRKRIAEAVRSALQRADVVITCGGLGPTVDDMTRQSIADATDRTLMFQQELYEQIVARFESYRVTMTENNRQQAFLPEGAIPITNPVGTAPAFMVEVGDKVVISLPGVPREMKFLMQERVIPYLREKYALGIIKARTLKTAGIGESSLDDRLGHDLLAQANPTVGLAAHHGTIDIRITAKAQNAKAADAILQTAADTIYERAGEYIFGEGDDDLVDVLMRLLQQRQMTIAIAEAGIDAAAIAALRDHPVYTSVVTHTETHSHPHDLNAETDLRSLAESTAADIQRTYGTDVGIALLSYPDVNENVDYEHSTAVSVYADGEHRTRTYGFGAQSALAREWVSRWALSIVWRMARDMNTHVD